MDSKKYLIMEQLNGKERNGSFASIQSQVFILPDSSVVFLLHFVTLFL